MSYYKINLDIISDCFICNNKINHHKYDNQANCSNCNSFYFTITYDWVQLHIYDLDFFYNNNDEINVYIKSINSNSMLIKFTHEEYRNKHNYIEFCEEEIF